MFKFSKFNTAVNWNDTFVSSLQSFLVVIVYRDYRKYYEIFSITYITIPILNTPYTSSRHSHYHNQ